MCMQVLPDRASCYVRHLTATPWLDMALSSTNHDVVSNQLEAGAGLEVAQVLARTDQGPNMYFVCYANASSIHCQWLSEGHMAAGWKVGGLGAYCAFIAHHHSVFMHSAILMLFTGGFMQISPTAYLCE